MADKVFGAEVAEVNVVGIAISAAPGRIWFSSKTMVVRPPSCVVQVIWPTVNVKPSATAAEAGMMTILFVWRAIHTPPNWHTNVDES